MPWYAYGLCGPEPPATPRLRGLGDRAVEVLGDGPVRLVASPAGGHLDGLTEAAADVVVAAVVRHDDVLVRLAQQQAVLPLRFGTVLPDDDAVDELLADANGSLARRLAHIEAAAEWVVAVAVRADTDADPTASADPPDLTPGHAYFARRRAAAEAVHAARDRAIDAARALAEEMATIARGLVPLDLRDRDEVARGAYLVPHDAVDRLHDLVACARTHAEVDLDGPLPAYRFAVVGP